MKKHEVLSLLERFPELVDSDDLASDLLRQASDDTSEENCNQPADAGKPVRRELSTDAPPARPR